MIPKKSKDIIAEYAKDKTVPPEHIEIMVLEYWKEIRHKASVLEYWNLEIRGIGRISVNYKKIRQSFYKHLAEKCECKEGNNSYTYIALKEKIKSLANMLRILGREYMKRQEASRKKYEYLKDKYPRNELGGETKTGMGE